ncbi:sigma-70 family RNA polymerase sigma factor [Bacillus pinisoli]|uniref:sigma-70 family RNA polymerase sigma factor n=1 Tax=Bacillus pinisoli TaxID=2901866 RepID=UPI001FF2A833|nr:sigma-70 family RNA polymerase sigma factor [Bacillus pinisoli]
MVEFSFEQVVEKESWLIKSVIKNLHIYKELDDYYQEGLIGLWEAYQRYDSSIGASFRTFAYYTIRGKLLTRLKKRKKQEDREATLSDAVTETLIDEWANQPFELETVLSYCRDLTESQRKWVLMTIIEGKRPREIAEEEQVSIETVKSWRRYALQKMRKNMSIELN